MSRPNAKISLPELTKYLDRRITVSLNASRCVSGILRGFDQFLNLTMEECVEINKGKKAGGGGGGGGGGEGADGDNEMKDGEKGEELGTVVVRGNSVLMIEAMEKI